jgi:cell division protein FtsB
MSDEIKYMAANATSEEMEAVYLHYDKLRLNERGLKAKIEQLQKENTALKANNTINEIEKRLSIAERLLESLMKDFANDQ